MADAEADLASTRCAVWFPACLMIMRLKLQFIMTHDDSTRSLTGVRSSCNDTIYYLGLHYHIARHHAAGLGKTDPIIQCTCPGWMSHKPTELYRLLMML